MLIERAYAHVPATDEFPADQWPWRVPAVAQLLDGGLRFTTPVTFLVGENGSGKSTLVEALAEGFGLDSYGGRAGYKYASGRDRSGLGQRIRFDATRAGRRMLEGPRTRRKGFFLRAETALDALEREDVAVHSMSHGEGFLTAFREMFRQPGLYVMDEPEAALSFTSCLHLVGLMHELGSTGAQVICATHSPLLTATPGATILEIGEAGAHAVQWDELAIVDHWRRYLADPNAYLRHIIGT
ncbi:AAA family ATPase [Streptomyces sp. H10-C2]|uniref:AAA family ATPase n=1 Tax=unclassified Streptomyces TaxID=2593676 RepID=UPI0024BA3A4E|nr:MULTISPECIES: AAA family ATPase [unclassified Streptomyces]MDJ0343262.1 AAA family ATPase [Streptomyces sp. PH10-H1]MDJ0370605.1 AAA family ATPase [Streptomyces sp. H10-C2]